MIYRCHPVCTITTLVVYDIWCPKIVEIEIMGMPYGVEFGTVEIFERWCMGLARRVRVILG
jgi:hypothetical protein